MKKTYEKPALSKVGILPQVTAEALVCFSFDKCGAA